MGCWPATNQSTEQHPRLAASASRPLVLPVTASWKQQGRLAPGHRSHAAQAKECSERMFLVCDPQGASDATNPTQAAALGTGHTTGQPMLCLRAFYAWRLRPACQQLQLLAAHLRMADEA
jgi:hypothetical protein